MLSAALLACSLLGYLLRGAVPSPAAASTSAACAPLVAADRRPPVAAACRRPIARLAHAFAVPASAGQHLRLAAADCRPPRVIITRMAHGRTLTIAQSMQRLWIFFSQMRRIGLLLPHTEYLPKKKKSTMGLMRTSTEWPNRPAATVTPRCACARGVTVKDARGGWGYRRPERGMASARPCHTERSATVCRRR